MGCQRLSNRITNTSTGHNYQGTGRRQGRKETSTYRNTSPHDRMASGLRATYSPYGHPSCPFPPLSVRVLAQPRAHKVLTIPRTPYITIPLLPSSAPVSGVGGRGRVASPVSAETPRRRGGGRCVRGREWPCGLSHSLISLRLLAARFPRDQLFFVLLGLLLQCLRQFLRQPDSFHPPVFVVPGGFDLVEGEVLVAAKHAT